MKLFCCVWFRKHSAAEMDLFLKDFFILKKQLFLPEKHCSAPARNLTALVSCGGNFLRFISYLDSYEHFTQDQIYYI